MTKRSCSNRTVSCPICLCEYLYMCVFVLSIRLTIGFANILIARVQILEERGHIWQCQWLNRAREAVSGYRVFFLSLTWRKCGSGQTDSSMLEPLFLASEAQYCEPPPVPWLRTPMNIGENEKNCRNRQSWRQCRRVFRRSMSIFGEIVCDMWDRRWRLGTRLVFHSHLLAT